MVTQPWAAYPGAGIDELVRGRRSVRLFRQEPIARAVIEDLIAEAVWAPSPHNSQPWRFTVLFDTADKERLAEAMATQLARELLDDGLEPAAIQAQTDRSRSRIIGAPVVLLCSLERDGLVEYADRRRNELEWQMAVQSVGAVLQTLFLLAWSRGIGSCWMAAPMYCPDIVRDVLDLSDAFAPQALALFGYPSREARIRPRRSLWQVMDLR